MKLQVSGIINFKMFLQSHWNIPVIKRTYYSFIADTFGEIVNNDFIGTP